MAPFQQQSLVIDRHTNESSLYRSFQNLGLKETTDYDQTVISQSKNSKHRKKQSINESAETISNRFRSSKTACVNESYIEQLHTECLKNNKRNCKSGGKGAKMKKYNYCEGKSTTRLNNHMFYIFIYTNMINNNKRHLVP